MARADDLPPAVNLKMDASSQIVQEKGQEKGNQVQRESQVEDENQLKAEHQVEKEIQEEKENQIKRKSQKQEHKPLPESRSQQSTQYSPQPDPYHHHTNSMEMYRCRYPNALWASDRQIDIREDLPPPRLKPVTKDDDDVFCWDDEYDY